MTSGHAWVAGCVVALAASGCRGARPCAYALIDGICPVPCESAPGELCYPDGGVVGADGGVDGAVDAREGGVDAAGDVGDGGAEAASDGDGATDGGDADAAPSCASGPCVRQVAVSGGHACAVRMDGTVWCWGSNAAGQLGDGTTTTHLRPTQVPGLSGVRQVQVAGDNSCAVLESGTLECWGDNSQGLLGNGSTGAPALVPTPVSALSGVGSVAFGTAHLCAQLRSGAIECWGQNGLGELGNGMIGSDSLTPVAAVGISTAVQVAAGGYISCAVLDGGAIDCWGDSNAGEAGAGTASRAYESPVTVMNIDSALQVVAGDRFVCARLADQSVRCWGDDSTGQLGDGASDQQDVPVTVIALGAVVDLAAGLDHACARLVTGALYCWGGNTAGALGDGSMTARNSAVMVLGISNTVQIAAGGNSTCAVLSSGLVECWGSNDQGQLGTGDTTNRATPALVEF